VEGPYPPSISFLQDVIPSNPSYRRVLLFPRKYTFVLQFPPAEVEQQANRCLGGFQIIDYLGKLIAGQLVAESFYLYNDLAFHEKIQVEQGDLLAFIHDRLILAAYREHVYKLKLSLHTCITLNW
jgi:hypothetical protein